MKFSTLPAAKVLTAVAVAAGTLSITAATASPAEAVNCYKEHYLTNDTTGVYGTRSVRDGRHVLSDLIKTKSRGQEVTRLSIFYRDPEHTLVNVGSGYEYRAWMRTEKLDFWYRESVC